MTANGQNSLIQITFHYTNGQTESFNVLLPAVSSVPLQAVQQQIVQLLDKPWCILHLPEHTLCINTAHILKVETKPSMREVQDSGVFSDVRRVTALSRTTQK